MTTKKSADDAGQAEVQAKADEAAEKGFIGVSAPGLPNERYTLKTGPESPSHAEEREAAAKAVK